jgi:hypothetical protein
MSYGEETTICNKAEYAVLLAHQLTKSRTSMKMNAQPSRRAQECAVSGPGRRAQESADPEGPAPVSSAQLVQSLGCRPVEQEG